MFGEFSKFRKDITNANSSFKVWGPLLNGTLIFGGFYFYQSSEALLLSIATIVSLIIAIKIHQKLPLSRLIGICHTVWLPLYPFLLLKLKEVGTDQPFGVWLSLSLVLITVSLVFDIYDVYRFIFSGNKTFSQRS